MSLLISETPYKTMADSEVYQTPNEEAYERTIVLTGWDQNQPNRLAQIRMKIHRMPGSSWATASVWTENGWVEVYRPASVLFWYEMPSASRWRQDKAEAKTRHLAYGMAHTLGDIAENSNL